MRARTAQASPRRHTAAWFQRFRQIHNVGFKPFSPSVIARVEACFQPIEHDQQFTGFGGNAELFREWR